MPPADPATSDDLPTLDAFEVRDLEQPQFVAWCPWCQGVHRHGPFEGHRSAHCHEPSSPFQCSGYDLRRIGAVNSEDEIVPETYGHKLRHPLRSAIHGELKEFRAVLLRALFGLSVTRSRQFCFMHDLGGGFRVVLIDQHWIIERPNVDKIEGDGLLTLAARLHGVPVGVVGVRLLGAALGLSIEGDAAIDLAAVIDRWHARGALSRIAKL